MSLGLNTLTTAKAAAQATFLECNVGALGTAGETRMAVNATTISHPMIGQKRRNMEREDNPISMSSQTKWLREDVRTARG